MTRVLITGGCGFIGHHMVEHVLKNTDWEIVVLDRLSYAAIGYDRLRDIKAYDHRRVKQLAHNFVLPLDDGIPYEIGRVDFIIHMGAETHVENSISDPKPFVLSNVLGTMNMLEFARRQIDLKAFLYFSTDEVFGPAPEGTEYKEWDRYNSTNPYSATKASGEELTLAWGNSYKIPVVITHCMNAFGERQHPEKFIPNTITKVIQDEKVLIHSDSNKLIPGSRYWIHARNIADAVLFLLTNGFLPREKYNIVGSEEVDNLRLAKMIARDLGKELIYEMVDFHSSRPGHDLRYALSGVRLATMGWTPPVDFEETLERTLMWFLDNDQWLNLSSKREFYNVA